MDIEVWMLPSCLHPELFSTPSLLHRSTFLPPPTMIFHCPQLFVQSPIPFFTHTLPIGSLCLALCFLIFCLLLCCYRVLIFFYLWAVLVRTFFSHLFLFPFLLSSLYYFLLYRMHSSSPCIHWRERLDVQSREMKNDAEQARICSFTRQRLNHYRNACRSRHSALTFLLRYISVYATNVTGTSTVNGTTISLTPFTVVFCNKSCAIIPLVLLDYFSLTNLEQRNEWIRCFVCNDRLPYSPLKNQWFIFESSCWA